MRWPHRQVHAHPLPRGMDPGWGRGAQWPPKQTRSRGRRGSSRKAGSSASQGGPCPGGPKGRFPRMGAAPVSPITWGQGPSLGLPDTNRFRRFNACPYHPRGPLDSHGEGIPTRIAPAVSSGLSPGTHTRAPCQPGLRTGTARGAGRLRSPRRPPATGRVGAGKHAQGTAMRERRAPRSEVTGPRSTARPLGTGLFV